MQIRCPHCQNGIKLVVESDLQSVDCPSCGSQFGLVDVDQESVDTFDSAHGGNATIGHFELIEEVGRGAFGSVWRAHDTKLDRKVAIKVPRPGQFTQSSREQFLREARAAAQLNHPNIVSVYEVGLDDDRIYIVSDFVDGISLADLLSADRLSPRQAIGLCVKVALALEHAHENGVIHRDLKPANIMLGENNEPFVMDFGLAKRDAGEITMTLDGKLLGTPAYMPPEQARGEGHHVDRRADVYSMGVVLYELLTGELPFRGTTRMLLHQVMHEEAPSPRKLNNSIPRDLETITLKCLEKEPDKRYDTCAALGEDLQAWLDHKPIKARRTMLPLRILRWCKRKPLVATLFVTTMSLVAMMLTVGVDYFAKDPLQQIITELDEQDPLWRLEDIEDNRKKVPSNENTALKIISIHDQISSLPETDIIHNIFHQFPSAISKQHLVLMRDTVATNDLALEQARQLAQYQHGRFNLNWDRTAFATTMPHLKKVREVHLLLSFDAVLESYSGNMTGAFESLQNALICSQSIGDEPTLISQLIRLHGLNRSIRTLEIILKHGEMSDRQLVLCQSIFREESKVPVMEIGIRGDRGGSNWFFTEAANHGPDFWKELVGEEYKDDDVSYQGKPLRQAHATALKRLTELLRIFELDGNELLVKSQQFDIETEENSIAGMFAAKAELLARRRLRRDAELSCVLLAIAAERFRRKSGNWPEALTALVPEFIEALISDPYSGAQIKLLRINDGIVIYSPGDDGKDNDGVLGGTSGGSNTDIGFRLWDANKRLGGSGSP